MQLVCIICISASLVITSWSSACFGAAARTTIPLASDLMKSEEVFLKDSNIFENSPSKFVEKTHSNEEQLKQELFALRNENTKVSLSTINGDKQNHTYLSSSGNLSSPSRQNVSIGVDNGASVESASNDFAVDNGINVPSIVDINKSNLISSNDSANIVPEKKEEQTFLGLAEKYTSTSVQHAANNLPKVVDPTFRTLAAISRRANRKHRNQNNHDRIKRSSLSRDNIGDEKYLRNVIDVEKEDFEYRRPWRISEPKIFSLMEETKYNSKKDYPKYQGPEGIVSASENQVDSRHKSSLEDQYHKQTSSYHPVSSPLFVSDDSLPVKSISSSLSSSYSASNLDSTEDLSSSSSKRFQSKNSVFFKPHKKRDHELLNQQNTHHGLKESDFQNIPVVQSKLSSLSVNDITYGSKDNYNNPVMGPRFASSNQRFLQKTDDAPHSVIEEPLVLASQQQARLAPQHKVGQREQLPAATSNIIESGKSMVRNIMKRRSKTGRYDVPQVGK